MAAGGQVSPSAHSRLKLCGNRFEFEDCSTPRIVFRDHEIVIGCKTISRDAFDELQKRYQDFLSGRREQVIQG